ncbi:oxysterol binding family protein [Heterostelium album PN500]|uniref:Oxysterol binding family protein n=1 Tax=Heterostelium pallidum (strain ATCC 26659 / Pp 5 / PN500) TaxID=670386 RepID=D3BQ11_HETP5|nr:oxysterol binding family protein [Heterostelium album PN500]EFA76562.1 oxysterol binding family protein [Heterostelium album PN500]|eukprot:XP_020428694.1 oxysterol binding family protein [Heterostelium album PN500]
MSKLFKRFGSSSESNIQTVPEKVTSTEDEETLTESKKDILMHLIKQIKVGSEIKHIALPCFLLQPRSLLESLTDNFNCLEELFKIQTIENEQERFIQFIKFSLSAWNTRPKGIKKPFNPIIGETYDCFWDSGDSNGDSHFISEQISHHPPHSAFCFYNKKEGIIVNANLSTNYVKFYGNFAESSLKGTIVYHFLRTNDTYEMTMPTIGVRGILLGKLGSYVNGKTVIRKMGTSYTANIEFLSKSIVGSSKHHNGVKGTIDFENKHLYKIKGNWDNQVIISPISHGSDIVLLNVHNVKLYPHKSIPFDQRPETDSSHIWKIVEEGILSNNDQVTSKEKQRIEENQRKDEQYRKDNGIKWVPKNFVLKGNPLDFPPNYVYKELENIFPEVYASKPTS